MNNLWKTKLQYRKLIIYYDTNFRDPRIRTGHLEIEKIPLVKFIVGMNWVRTEILFSDVYFIFVYNNGNSRNIDSGSALKWIINFKNIQFHLNFRSQNCLSNARVDPLALIESFYTNSFLNLTLNSKPSNTIKMFTFALSKHKRSDGAFWKRIVLD